MHSDEQGDDKGLRLLIELGGNVDIKHECMELTPLEAAVQQGQDECVQIRYCLNSELIQLEEL